MSTRFIAVGLILCVLIVGSLASAQTVSHETHHTHHQATTHASPFCSWMCAAGQMSEAGLLVFPQHVSPVAYALFAAPLAMVAPPARTDASRGPPASI